MSNTRFPVIQETPEGIAVEDFMKKRDAFIGFLKEFKQCRDAGDKEGMKRIKQKVKELGVIPRAAISQDEIERLGSEYVEISKILEIHDQLIL